MASLITFVWFNSYHCQGFDASRQYTDIILICAMPVSADRQQPAPASIWRSIELK
ncbi:hypothetical protein QUA56_24380 [Microcoleus sp. N3A4]|uniref:hypothetical protein n=1 Tax=Microcoleus sp. N3A4 TaxID=3055379 RepID=UPI002FD63015